MLKSLAWISILYKGVMKHDPSFRSLSTLRSHFRWALLYNPDSILTVEGEQFLEKMSLQDSWHSLLHIQTGLDWLLALVSI